MNRLFDSMMPTVSGDFNGSIAQTAVEMNPHLLQVRCGLKTAPYQRNDQSKAQRFAVGMVSVKLAIAQARTWQFAGCWLVTAVSKPVVKVLLRNLLSQIFRVAA
jgi:hypothetical protein